MSKPIRVIFLESHFDPVTNTLKSLLPNLVSENFKTCLDEHGSNNTLDSLCKTFSDNIKEIKEEMSKMTGKEQSEERMVAKQFLDTNSNNLLFLSLLREKKINYKCIDLPNIEDQYLSEEKSLSTDELKQLTLNRSKAMLKAYLETEENTFGIMGFMHAPEVMQELMQTAPESSEQFIFIYPYNQNQLIDEEEEKFIEIAKKGDFPHPVHCFDMAGRTAHTHKIDAIFNLIKEKLKTAPDNVDDNTKGHHPDQQHRIPR